MNVLVSSAGRRGALVRIIRDTIAPCGGRVFGIDAGSWSAACRLADDWQRVPRCDDPHFVDAVFEYSQAQNIQLIIPTIDPELPIYSAHRERFAAAGIHIAISGPESVRIGGDKLATHEFLIASGLPTVERFNLKLEEDLSTLKYPLILKPRFGSASNGVHLIDDEESLRFYYRRVDEPIVQEVAGGSEYTINFYVNRSGQSLVAVPHQRIETRGGEVSKCITVRQQTLIDLADKIADSLPDAWGPMCYQAFVDDKGRAKIIEINTRFGGGYPIAHHAGANFVQCLINEVHDQTPSAADYTWADNIAMTRFDDAVFTTAEDVAA